MRVLSELVPGQSPAPKEKYFGRYRSFTTQELPGHWGGSVPVAPRLLLRAKRGKRDICSLSLCLA